LDTRRTKVAELERRTSAPDFWNDTNKARELLDQVARERELLNPYDALLKRAEDAAVLIEMAAAESDEDLSKMAAAEAESEIEPLDRAVIAMELKSMLGGPVDRNNAFVTFHAGAGGTEACDWAAMLHRMIRRYCERKDFKVEMLDYQDGEEAGLKSASLQVIGPYAYGYLKSERGVHRLVRISPYDSNKRRHTSFASVDVVAEIDDSIEIEILDADIRVDTFRSSGSGGQHVNKTDSAIRITHMPSGFVVSCQTQRSQHQNRAQAMKMLKSRLYELELDKKKREMDRFYGDKGDIAWGNQIRSYVLQPYTMAKDERTELKNSNVQAVLDGDLDLFVEAYLKKLRLAGSPTPGGEPNGA
jgi:peptide chain release factor 2